MTRVSKCLVVLGFALVVLPSCGEDSQTRPGSDLSQTDDTSPDSEPPPDMHAAAPDAAASVDTGPSPDASDPDTQIPPDAEPPKCNSALEGTYPATFSLTTTEKVGSSIINEMSCSGALTATHSCAQSPAIKGSYSCDYSGGLVIFDKKQSGTIEGKGGGDGTFTGSVSHKFNDSLNKKYTTTGSIVDGKIAGDGKGSLYPHPQSAVAWEVSFSF